MKNSALRICVLALGAVLFNSHAAMAGCYQICQPTGLCANAPNFPEWACLTTGTFCWDGWCPPPEGDPEGFDKGLITKIGEAVLAGDTHTVTLLAAKVGQPFRLFSEGKILYDGFALAGLKGPGPDASSTERLAAKAACRSTDSKPSAPAATAEPTTDPAAATAVVPEER